MAVLDLILVVLLVLAAFVGYRRGAVLQVFTFGGLLAGLLVGALLVPVTTRATDDPSARAAIAATTLLVSAAIGDIAGWLLGARLRAAARDSRFRPADAAGGSILSIGAVVLAVWILSFNLVNGPFYFLANEIRRSVVVREIDSALPEPPPILRDVRRLFNALGFPDLFVGLPPVPADPVRAPSQATAQRAFRAVRASTVRVVGTACGRVQEGSGFVVGGGLLVTNAHVVAGEHITRVDVDGERRAASTVLFDPAVDIAVLRVPSGIAPPLPLAPTLQPRGTGGAVVGYPGGGGLQGRRAATRGSILATSPDIYGNGATRRRLYELQTSVIPGNSGGPFALPGGRVAGVVVSASTTDRDLAYAIASTEVIPLVERARGRTATASTGPCTA